MVNLTPTALPAAADLAKFAIAPSSPAVPGASEVDPMTAAIRRARAERITREESMTIPAVRRAVHVIQTIATFTLDAWTGTRRLPDGTIPWLAQPDPDRPLTSILRRSIDDLIWHDRSHWRITPDISGAVKYMTRIRPDRVLQLPNPNDVDGVGKVLVDGNKPAYSVLTFDGAGIGGLDRFGAALLAIYLTLQEAAGKYADAPHPKATLKNNGDDLNDEEIEDLLQAWEEARTRRSVGYLNSEMDYNTYGWNPQELQLTEAREHAALEVARLFGLPARSVNAKSGDSMTYSTDIMANRAQLEALRPMMTIFEQTLSMNDRRDVLSGVVSPRNVKIKFNADAYTRDDAKTRFDTWALALNTKDADGRPILTVDEIRAQEPFSWS